MRRGLLALLLALGLAGAALATDHARAGATPGPRVTMFGDSVADAIEYVPEAESYLAAGLDLRLELAPCRKLVPPGCPYMGVRPPSVLDLVQASTPQQLGDVVVVDVGYNDPANNYDTDMPQVVEALLARDVAHVIWVTMREQDDDYRTINQIIRTQARRWPQVEVVDWNAASRGQDWFQPDGLHLNAAGAVGLARLLRPSILAACGSPCQPAGPPPARSPRSVKAPSLSGTPVVGHVLRCLAGTWSGPRPFVFSYRWLRGTRVLPGERARSRRLVQADAGALVSCRVWASNANGAARATSRPVRVRAAS